MTSTTKAERAQDAPKGLHAVQYAAWLAENRLALPANQSNLAVIGDAIASISMTKFRDAKWKNPVFTAFVWLDRQCEFAKMAGIPTNHLFFLNGGYNEVPEANPKLLPFVQCGKDGCTDGWKYKNEVRYGRPTAHVVSCECRLKYIAEAKKRKL